MTFDEMIPGLLNGKAYTYGDLKALGLRVAFGKINKSKTPGLCVFDTANNGHTYFIWPEDLVRGDWEEVIAKKKEFIHIITADALLNANEDILRLYCD